MPTYAYECLHCHHTEDAVERVADRDQHACPVCTRTMARQVTSCAIRGDVQDWSTENNGRGRYIGQLQRTRGKKIDRSAYCKNRQHLIDKAHKRGLHTEVVY